MEPNEFKSIVGKRIRDMRKTAGLTAEQLSNDTGLSRSSITNIEKGRQNISAYHLFKISNRLNCIRIDDLMPQTKRSIMPDQLKAWDKKAPN